MKADGITLSGLLKPVAGGRLGFIDLTRGLVMILMAWDHVSGFWNKLHGGLEGSREQYGAHA